MRCDGRLFGSGLVVLAASVAAAAERGGELLTAVRDRGDVLFVCDFEADDWYREWGARRPAETTETVAADPQRKFEPLSGKALRVRVAKDDHYGANLQFRFQQRTGSEPEEIYFRYDLRLADDWDPHRGGKFPGIAGTYGRAGWGGRPVNGRDGWSARGLFGGRDEGKTPIGFYAYHVDMRGRYGSNWWWDRENRGRLDNNRWYAIEQHVRMNTPGRKDGVLRGWVDGDLAFEKNDVHLRDVAALKIETVWLNVYLGGSWTSLKDQHLYLDNVVIARNPIGPMRE